MLLYLTFIAALVIAIVVITGLRRKDRRVRMSLLWPGALLVIGGVVLGVFATNALVSATEKTYWPSAAGVVTSSTIVGGRAFRPEVKYRYSVGNANFVGVSDLNPPGFGSRNKRLEVAEKLVALYPTGNTIPVYFNPEQPSESILVRRVSWNIYVQLGVAITLALAGAVILVFFAYRPRES